MRSCLGCHRPIPQNQRRCADCQRREYQRRNAARAGTLEKIVYSSNAYKKARAEVMAGAYACAWCGATGVRLVAGHIVPIGRDPDAATSVDNLAPICDSCNNRDRRMPPRGWRG